MRQHPTAPIRTRTPAEPPRWRAWLFAGLAALAALAAGCGGGVDSGGTGAPMVSTVTVGPIAGFGSIVVGGVHYDETSARLQDDEGRPLATEDLKLGMQATIEAGAIGTVGGVASAQASSVTVGATLLGPVSAVDASGCTATVLGQRVAAVAATLVDASVPGSASACRIAALTSGQWLVVHGQWDLSRQRLVASRIERTTQAPAHYVLRGPVSDYSASARTLRVGSEVLDLSDLPVATLPASVATGTQLRLSLATEPRGGRWRVTALDSHGLPVADVAEAELEGRVTALVAAQRFLLNGVPVDTSRAVFVPSSAGLVLGAKVEARGPLNGGVLVASTVKIEADDDETDLIVELEGRVTAVDRAAASFVLRGLTVSWSQQPSVEGGTLEDIVVGRKLSVKGRASTDGRTIIATQIHLED